MYLETTVLSQEIVHHIDVLIFNDSYHMSHIRVQVLSQEMQSVGQAVVNNLRKTMSMDLPSV